MLRPKILAALAIAALAGSYAHAQSEQEEARALASAKRDAALANARSEQLERQAARATDEAARARADASALASRIEAAESDITAAEARVRLVEMLRAQQRARLAEKQEPIVRLTAALQTMARRPPALALIEPGSLGDLVHVRALLASTLPVIRRRTAELRAEVASGDRLRREAQTAVAALVASRSELQRRRVQLADFELQQRTRSASLAASASFESDRALALGEDVRELSAEMGTLQYQARLRQSLSQLPGPSMRPSAGDAGPGANGAPAPDLHYLLPVAGRVVTGMGEISDAGVHARGLTFEAPANAPVVAPAGGRVAYAGRFRSYGDIVIIDHGRGWTSAITNLGALAVTVGDAVQPGTPIGRTGSGQPRIGVELRQQGRPVAIAPLLGG